LPAVAAGALPDAGTDVTVLVRPEAVIVDADDRGPGVVLVATFRGSTTRLRVALDDGYEVQVDVPSHRGEDVAPGRRVRLSLLDRPALLSDD
jgi:putative spermidine/putrescine transport system ATP-binding protein